MAGLSDLPPEILRIIAQLIYLDHLPRSLFRCIDPHGLPSTYPDGRLISSTQHLTKRTLHALCLTNSALYHAAKPLLWRRLQITLPYSFLLLLRSLGVSRLAEAYEQQHVAMANEENDTQMEEDDEAKEEDEVKAEKLQDARMDFNAMLSAVGFARVTGGTIYATKRMVTAGQQHPEAMDLVWIEETRDARGTGSRYQVTFQHDDSDVSDVHKFPRVLDFSTFTTQGLRRTVGEGQDARFVTPAKLLALITAVSKGLMAFGASSSMDSALSLEVLEALLFRDGENVVPKAHHSLRGVSIERSMERKHERRRRLESLDLCNCVSPHFEAALSKFVNKHLKKFSGRVTSTVPEEDSDQDVIQQQEEEGRGRTRRRESSRTMTPSRSMSTRRSGIPSSHPARPTMFPFVHRLGLLGVHFSPDIISPFVLAFPHLTHLDLTGTKVDDDFLMALGASPDMELESLSLARCPRISSQCITELIVDSPVCSDLIELSLEGSLLFPTPITNDDLKTIITTAPCLRSGSLRYLDLGGCGLNDDLLNQFGRQPALLDFGMASTPTVSLETLSSFLINKAPNVQLLELVDSCYDPRQGHMSIVRLNAALLEPCTTVPPLSISEQLAAMGFAADGQAVASLPVRQTEPRTNLRTIGLSMPTLQQFRGALGNWRVIFGQGRRGWLVDISSGPDPEAVDEDLILDDSLPHDMKVQNSLRGSVSPLARSPRTYLTERRGRDPQRSVPSGFEPETPPRRASRSPSVGMARSHKEGSARLSRNVSLSHSHSRSRQLGTSLAEQEASEIANKSEENSPVQKRNEVIRNLPGSHPRRLTLERLAQAKGHVEGTIGWHSKKMEVLLGLGMLGRESGLYAYAAYQA